MMFRNFFRGRYGVDTITYVLLFAALILMNLPVRYVWIIGFASAGYAFFRVLSKDIGRRTQELQKFNVKTMKIRQFIMNLGMRLQQRKQYVFLTCPECKKTLRLPRNKGKLLVTCPLCKYSFEKKT